MLAISNPPPPPLPSPPQSRLYIDIVSVLRTITSGRRRARRVCCATATPWARSRAPVTGTAVSVRVSRGSSGGSVTAVITPSLRSRPAAVKVRLSNTRSSGCHVSHNPSVTRVWCVCVCVRACVCVCVQ